MHRVARVLSAVVIAAMALCAVVGCSSDKDELEGTRWELTVWTVSSLDPADFSITAEFAEGQVSGSSAVNSYSGPYEANSDGALEVGDLAGTLIGGPEPAMRAESAYLVLLRQARSFKVTDGKLTLYDDGGNESLVFEAADD